MKTFTGTKEKMLSNASPRLPVFYRPEQVALNSGAYSPSARKPHQVVEDWLHHGIITAQDIHSFEPVTRNDLARVHQPQMVDDVLALKRRNGFRNMDAEVAASLPYTSGSMLAAARWALEHEQAACSPTSGFHHASYDEPEGYCTFNGLMVVAAKLLDEGLVRQVAILDCDMHYGNGTANIIERQQWQGCVLHFTMGLHFEYSNDEPGAAQRVRHWLLKAVHDCASADLVLFQASADPHVNDPLGGLLSTEELLWRDQTVFKAFAGKPLVWNLAGGYQRDEQGGIEPVLELHRNTAKAWISVTAP